MKVKALKRSTDIIRIIISTPPLNIKDGTITLNLYLSKNDKEKLISLPYSNLTVSYDFNFSKILPRNISDFEYNIVVSDDNSTEETRKVRLFPSLPHHLSGAIKKIQHDFSIISRKYNGSEALFFKKIPGEDNCTECWDNDLQSSNNSNCPVCGGTGKMRYFSNPYKTICGPIKWQQETYSIDNPGKALASTSVMISSLPDLMLTTDDVIFYKKTGEFFRVVSRTVSELQTMPSLQNFVANLIPSDYPDAEICSKLMGD